MVVNATGHCCGAGFTTIDVAGRCCASDAHVDACGVCGGDGVAVDALGTCCKSTLPASGICCVDSAGRSLAVDDCGVCGGVNACDAAVAFEVATGASTTYTDVALLSGIASAVASALGVSTASIDNVTLAVVDDATRRRLTSPLGARLLVGIVVAAAFAARHCTHLSLDLDLSHTHTLLLCIALSLSLSRSHTLAVSLAVSVAPHSPH
jgi:hypothetical protein